MVVAKGNATRIRGTVPALWGTKNGHSKQASSGKNTDRRMFNNTQRNVSLNKMLTMMIDQYSGHQDNINLTRMLIVACIGMFNLVVDPGLIAGRPAQTAQKCFLDKFDTKISGSHQ